MPINVYTGLMRSGKSYEVVSEVIVPAVRAGRRVVTNVDGISQDNIHDYLAVKFPDDDHAQYGAVVHVTNAQVFEPEFFPYYDDQKNSHVNTTVRPGDLVCIDEAWRFWPSSGAKVHKNHQSFFFEHGHFTNEKTGVACDLVLMIQDLGTLNRGLKSVVAFNFRTHKKVSLGLGNTYSVVMYEGCKQTKATKIGNWVRNYRKDIFPLYSSFKGGVSGKTVNADSRQNVFANKGLFWGMLGMLLFAGFCAYSVFRYFKPADANVTGKPSISSATPSASGSGAKPSVSASRAPEPAFSDTWRLTGTYHAQGRFWVVLTNQTGAVRLESPSMFQGAGFAQVGEIDGSRVTVYSGSTTSPPSSPLPTPQHSTGAKK